VATQEQKERMKQDGWLINPSPDEVDIEEKRITKLNE